MREARSPRRSSFDIIGNSWVSNWSTSSSLSSSNHNSNTNTSTEGLGALGGHHSRQNSRTQQQQHQHHQHHHHHSRNNSLTTSTSNHHHARISSVELNLQQLQECWATAPSDMKNTVFAAGTDTFPVAPHPLSGRSKSLLVGNTCVSTLVSEKPGTVRCCSSTATTSSAASAPTTSLSPKCLDGTNINININNSNTNTNGVSSMLHDAARITDWDKVLLLCETHPECASYRGRDGWTALHHACNRRCPRAEVAKALIQAHPGALLQQEEKGWLPLHYACRFKAPKAVVNLLLHMVPTSGKIAVQQRDKWGRTPLYYAVRYDAPPGVVRLLLQVDPAAVLEGDNERDESPLALVWDTWAEKLEGKRLIHSFLPGGFPEPNETTVEERAALLRQKLQKETKLKKRWQKVNMLLKAAFGFPVEDDDDDEDVETTKEQLEQQQQQQQRTWRIVHATASVKCHLSLFLLACALHPEQAREFDENDLQRPHNYCSTAAAAPAAEPKPQQQPKHQTALHLAASSNAGGEAGKTVLISLLSLYREAAEIQDETGSLPLHCMVENPKKQDWPNHAGILYHFYPRAVQIPDNQGRLPLHRAATAIQYAEPVDANDTDNTTMERSVVVQLVRAFPQATLQQDSSGCLPLHYVAANAADWDEQVESVFHVNRGAVQVRGGPKHQLPIHMAANNPNSSDTLLHKLIQLHPRGATLEDADGNFPLHLVCQHGKQWIRGGVKSVHDAFPQAIRMVVNGSLPLHLAAASVRSDLDLITKLVERYPHAACTTDSDGRYPLHLACAAGKSWSKGGLDVLFHANASALNEMDAHKQLPVMLAALKLADQRSKEPSVVASKLSKEVLEHQAADLDILYNLIRSDPSTVQSM